jgi:lipoprotein-anchoring transpeptidase ErfK/SrfK
VLGTTVVVVLVAGATGAAAWQYDASQGGRILPGVTVGGVAVGGLHTNDARAAVAAVWDTTLDLPVVVHAGDHVETVTARTLGARVDVDAAVARALASTGSLPLPVRLWHRVRQTPVRTAVPVARSVNRTRLNQFVRRLATAFDQPAVDATLDTSSGLVAITPARDGVRLRQDAARRALTQAVTTGTATIDLPDETIPARVHPEDFATVLLVRVGENKLYLYHGDQQQKVYDIATGMRTFPTPLGRFEIVNKRRNPTWVNPAKYPGGWGWKLPDRIPPGRKNPLGTRALDLSARGIRIHGTANVASIGFNASHGCIRMRIADVEDLFEQVPLGAPVVILRAGPDRTPPKTVHDTGPAAEADATPLPGASGPGPSPPPPG